MNSALEYEQTTATPMTPFEQSSKNYLGGSKDGGGDAARHPQLSSVTGESRVSDLLYYAMAGEIDSQLGDSDYRKGYIDGWDAYDEATEAIR